MVRVGVNRSPILCRGCACFTFARTSPQPASGLFMPREIGSPKLAAEIVIDTVPGTLHSGHDRSTGKFRSTIFKSFSKCAAHCEQEYSYKGIAGI